MGTPQANYARDPAGRPAVANTGLPDSAQRAQETADIRALSL